MNTERKRKIQLKTNIVAYLSQLKQLTRINVVSEDLLSLSETAEITKRSSHLEKLDKICFTTNFEFKNSERFKRFITNLSKANNSLVYIWLEKTNYCGLYKAASINDIDFSFRFDLDPNGIIVFMTEDLNNRLLLDFYRDWEERETIEIKIQGKQWYCVAF